MPRNYWDPYNIPTERKRSSSSLKLIALLIIILLTSATGLLMILGDLSPPTPTVGRVRVAVVDSGIDTTYVPGSYIVAEKSFILPQYGYDTTDTMTGDSHPEGTPHGSLVARTLVDASMRVSIINAKVISSDGGATSAGLVAAIKWAVEQNASVINLSLGSSPSYADPLGEAVEYAISHGVVVVAAAGNSGDGGLAGTSISSPSVYTEAICVGAMDEDNRIASYTSMGPTAERTMKPDLVAPGYAETSSAIYYGTSFASPRVAAAAADVIYQCHLRDIESTPGLVKTVLMKTAKSCGEAQFLQGAGAPDVDAAVGMIKSLEASPGETPLVTYVHPHSLPVTFERLFYGDNYTFNLQVFNSRMTTYSVTIETGTPNVFSIRSRVTINQTGIVPVHVHVPNSGPSQFHATINFTANGSWDALTIQFSCTEARAHVAFDTSHSLWSIDTVYGQFRELYRVLVQHSISVTELWQPNNITTDTLEMYDAVLVLDPCAWEIDETDPLNPVLISAKYSTQEIQAYRTYFESGGGIFVAGLDNDSIDVSSANELLAWSGFSFNYTRTPNRSKPVMVVDIATHPATAGVATFDFLGATITVPQNGTVLATYRLYPVLGCMEGAHGGRIVVAGTNFFIDNWGISREYNSFDDATLALQLISWAAALP
ncbi:MAG: S8 family peptidase [Candidatus Thorarchaeota archaeon]